MEAKDVEPDAVCTVPAGQSVLARHEDWFAPEVLVPAGHVAHERSALAEGGLVT